MENEFYSYGLDDDNSSPWIELDEDVRKKYLSPVKLSKILRSHTSVASNISVRGIAIDEFQGIIACSSQDGKINIWNIFSGELIGAYYHDTYASSIVIGANGTIISGGWDKKVKVWNCSSKRILQTLDIPGHVGCIAISFKCNYLCVGINYYAPKPNIVVWDLESFEQIIEIREETFWKFDLLAFNKTGEFLHARGGLGANRIWKMPSGNLLRAFSDSHYGEVSYCSIDDRCIILSTASDRHYEAYLWNTLSGKKIQVIDVALTVDGGPYCPNIILNSDGNILISAPLDGNIGIFSTKSKELLQEFPGNHQTSISSLAISDRYLATGDYDGILKLWEFTAQ
jgi:WD40 repeat protein